MIKRVLLAAAALSLAAQPALATDQKISAMPSASALGGSELIAGVQAGANVAITPAQILSYLQPSLQANLATAWVSGNWYGPAFTILQAGAAVPANSIRCVLQIMPAPMTVQALGARITTVGTTNVQLAVYPYAGGSPYLVSGNIPDTATGVITSGPLTPSTIPAGPYWACVNAADATVVFNTTSQAGSQAAWFRGSATESNISDTSGVSRMLLTQSQAMGTWPSLTPSSMTESLGASAAAIFLQAN